MAKILSPVFISCLFIFIANVVNCNLNYRIKRSNSLSSSDHHHQQHHVKPSIVYERRQNLTAIRLAYEHLNQIRTHYRCGTPRPTLIRVKDIYNVPSKEYLPRCTVLHQCNDQSGCCEDSTKRCAPSEGHEVQLFFYAIQIQRSENGNSSRERRMPFPEVLTFENHTKCQCEEINHRPRSTRINGVSIFSKAEDQDDDPDQDTLQHAHLCKFVECPLPFYARFNKKEKRCICDCFDRDIVCLRIKHGHEKLSAKETRCVRSRECLEPQCHLGGTFNHNDGSCVIPKHRHQHSHKNHNHYHNTNRLLERD